MRQRIRLLAMVGVAALGLAACGGGDGSGATFTVSGTVSGLATGLSLVLQNNGGDNLPVSANGTIAFHTPLAGGAHYVVTLATQPTGENCVVVNGSGIIATANINVAINCTLLSYTIGGIVSGLLSGNSLTLNDSAGGPITLSVNGTYTFGSPSQSGTAYSVTVAPQPTGQDCTVANGSGTVAGANVADVNVTCVSLPYAVSANVVGVLPNSQLVLQDNGGDGLTVSSGGTYRFSAAVASGSPYAVTVATQPVGQTCTVSGGSGLVMGAAVTVTVTCPWHVLYVATAFNYVEGFVIDPSTGNLAPVPGGQTPAGTSPTFVSADSSGKHVYVAGGPGGAPYEDSLYSFAIQSTTGALTQIGNAPIVVPLVLDPGPILLNPGGTFAYADDGSGTVLAIDATSGALVSTGSNAGLGTGGAVLLGNVASPPNGQCTIRPDGLFAYCPGIPVNPTAGVVEEFSLDPVTGAATQVASFSAGPNPQNITVTPDGAFAYVMETATEAGGNAIYAFTVDTASGALTPVVGNPVTLPQPPGHMVASPSGDALYVTVLGAVIGYSINPATGGLTLIEGAVATGPGSDGDLRIDRSGKFIYFLGSNGLGGASVDATTGVLTPITGSPFATGIQFEGTSMAIAAVIQ